MIHPLYKNKGTPTIPDGYRDITIADQLPKVVSNEYRAQVFKENQHECLNAQWGSGCNTGDTSIAHLIVRFFVLYAEKCSLSVCVVFIDVVAAFASMLRNIVFRDIACPEQWFRYLVESGFSDDEARNILSTAKDHGFEDTLASRFAQSYYRYTWSSLDNTPGVIVSTTGSLAGLPLADLIFIFANRHVLSKVRAALAEEGLIHDCVIGSERTPLHGASYVDDCVLPVFAAASDIVPKTSRALSIVARMFVSYRLVPNFSKGKT